MYSSLGSKKYKIKSHRISQLSSLRSLETQIDLAVCSSINFRTRFLFLLSNPGWVRNIGYFSNSPSQITRPSRLWSHLCCLYALMIFRRLRQHTGAQFLLLTDPFEWCDVLAQCPLPSGSWALSNWRRQQLLRAFHPVAPLPFRGNPTFSVHSPSLLSPAF